MKKSRLSNFELLAFSMPDAIVSMMVVPVIAILPTLYVENTKVSLAAVSGILLLTRVFDAISDQLIGYLSDRTLSMKGGRKVWMIAGTGVSVVAVSRLFFPDTDVGALYFGAWSVVFYLGWTMIAIPYMAWGAELSNDYHERTRIVMVRGFIGQIGNFLFLASPILFFYLNITDSTEISLDVINIVGWIVCISLPVSVAVAVIYTRASTGSIQPQRPILQVFVALKENQLFLRYVLAFVLAATGYGMFATLLFPFLTYHAHLGEQFAYISSAMAIGTLISIPVWLRISYRYGKHRSWAYGWALQGGALLTLLVLPSGGGGFIMAMVVLFFYGLFSGASAVVAPSILADIVDYGRLKNDADRAGTYFATHMLIVKLTFALGGGVAFALLGLFNYEMVQDVQNTAQANTGMLLAFIVIPVLLQAIAVPIIWNFPLNQRRQKIIEQRLEQRDSRVQGVINA